MAPMTVNELNELLARGAGQPGVREVETMMRLGWMLDQQARELSALYTGSSAVTVASNSGMGTEPSAAANANLG